MTKLRMIQKTAQHVVSAIAAAMGVDVAMIDTEYGLVATSKTFLEKRGTDMNKTFLEGVFARGTVVVPNPGHNELCAGCRYQGNCPETAEVHHTIRYNDKNIGVLFLVAYTQAQREILLNNTTGLLEFIGQMASLLCNEIRLQEMLEKEKVIKSQMESTIDFVDNGIITVNREGGITQINARAANILKVERSTVLGSKLESFLPYHHYAALIEHGQPIRGREIMTSSPEKLHCLISGNPVTVQAKTVGAVISIKDFSDFRSDVYEFTEKQIEYTFDDIYGKSDELRQIKEYAKEIALTDSNILIQGESGTGKELFARAIHSCSHRSTYPFLPINCAAIPEALLEAELFGYDEGAFSGAKKGGKPGKFEMANGGTIFLDEIGDMPLHMQAKLLRVLQGQVIERVGGIRAISIDVRIIAATNQDLDNMVRNRNFRKDLYFRLNVMPLNVPPLRNRGEDILLLANRFLAKYNKKSRKQLVGFTSKAIDLMMSYYWPGNVRELENAVEYAINMEKEAKIKANSLPSNLAKKRRIRSEKVSLLGKVRDYEKEVIKNALETYGKTVEGKRAAASRLGISLPTLYRRLKQLNIGTVD